MKKVRKTPSKYMSMIILNADSFPSSSISSLSLSFLHSNESGDNDDDDDGE